MTLIPAAWIVSMLFGVAICGMAARGDLACSDIMADPGRVVDECLTVWDDPPDLDWQQDNRRQVRPKTPRGQIAVHDVR